MNEAWNAHLFLLLIISASGTQSKALTYAIILGTWLRLMFLLNYHTEKWNGGLEPSRLVGWISTLFCIVNHAFSVDFEWWLIFTFILFIGQKFAISATLLLSVKIKLLLIIWLLVRLYLINRNFVIFLTAFRRCVIVNLGSSGIQFLNDFPFFLIKDLELLVELV